MTTNPGDGAKVTYSIKELLQDIRLSIASLDTKLDSKADKADVAVLVQSQRQQDDTLKDHEHRLAGLEKTQADRKDSHRFRTPLFISLATTLVSPFLWYGVYHIH